VRLSTAATLTGWTAAGSGVGKTLTAPTDATSHNSFDGVAAVLTDRILVKNGPSNVDNGIYTLTTLGNGAGTSAILTRALDCDQDVEVFDGVTVWVREGSTLNDTRWTIITNNTITVDTTAIVWVQTAGTGTFTGGDGIDITAGVISVDLDTDAGLEFDATKLQVKLNGTTLSRTASGLAVLGLPSLFTINGVAVGATVTAPNLDTLTNGSDADALHTHNSVQANRLEDELTANEAEALADPIEWGGANNQTRKCRADDGAKVDVIGVVEEAGGIAATATGTVVRRGVATGVLVGATVGDRYYVGNTGGLVLGTAPISAGNHIVFVGTAKNATDLEVHPQYIAKKAA
jgi:hypothetical protein